MFRVPLLLTLSCCCVLAQAPDKVEFEVVSIKPSAPPNGGRMTVSCHGGPGTADPTLLVCENWDLANLVAIAYRFDFFHVIALDWMHDARFELRAKVPDGTTREQFALMWQNLLADRFKLTVHRETRQAQTYDLVVAKGGPKFKPAAGGGNAIPPNRGPVEFDQDGFPSFGPGHPGIAVRGGRWRLYFPQMTIQALVSQLLGPLGAPVRDATGLDGKYEIGLYWASDGLLDNTPDAGPRLADALRDQLGLRLESKKAPAEFLVVDHAERVPTDN